MNKYNVVDSSIHDEKNLAFSEIMDFLWMFMEIATVAALRDKLLINAFKFQLENQFLFY